MGMGIAGIALEVITLMSFEQTHTTYHMIPLAANARFVESYHIPNRA
jgi:hypothetical protein